MSFLLPIVFLFVFSFNSLAILKKNIPIIPYMDQVINRKVEVIREKCLKSASKKVQGFMMVEVGISKERKVEVRLISTEIKSQDFITCSLSILKRVKFQKVSQHSVTRIYRFFLN